MLKPQIALEEKIRKQIYNALQGKYLEKIIRKLNSTSSENYWQSRMEGHSFKIEPEIMPKLYEIFDGVKTGLGYKRQVDFYVLSDSESQCVFGHGACPVGAGHHKHEFCAHRPDDRRRAPVR